MMMTAIKPMNLVKYAGDFWVTLADYTVTRDVDGYSGHASVKSAIRTFVVKTDPGKYIAFRGEQQIKNIIQENKNNVLFHPEDFEGQTRTALIHWTMLDALNDHFKADQTILNEFNTFMEEAEDIISEKAKEVVGNNEFTVTAEDNIIESRSAIQRKLREELSRIEKRIEVDQRNKEKILQALNALESLELEGL